jgi:CheY-like chemotaxis protein
MPASSRPPVILLTSSGALTGAADRQSVGISATLHKPLSRLELIETMLIVSSACVPAVAPPLRVLVAEDNAVNRKFALRILERLGHSVTVVVNGAEALAHVREHACDVVLMDMQMPVMDGLEATARIRSWEQASGAHVPVIAMTANAMDGDRERCLAAGMDDYVPKPIELARLIEVLARAAAGYAMRAVPLGAGLCKAAPLAAGSPFELAEALARMGGDAVLLREIAGSFLEDCPEAIKRIGAAVAAGDAAEIRQAAHALKGAVSNFSVGPVYEAAREMERLGREGELAAAGKALPELQTRLAVLQSALQALVSEGVVS